MQIRYTVSRDWANGKPATEEKETAILISTAQRVYNMPPAKTYICSRFC